MSSEPDGVTILLKPSKAAQPRGNRTQVTTVACEALRDLPPLTSQTPVLSSLYILCVYVTSPSATACSFTPLPLQTVPHAASSSLKAQKSSPFPLPASALCRPEKTQQSGESSMCPTSPPTRLLASVPTTLPSPWWHWPGLH